MNHRIAGMLGIVLGLSASAEPRVTVTRDDTTIDRSCEVWIPPGTVIADANTNGVLHIVADGITVRFANGCDLRGAPANTPWDQLRGIGIRVEGRKGVHLVGARVHGFFNGVVASKADGLEIDGGDFSDNYRQHLRSTPEAEDGADWLFPHNNDEQKWREAYGGALCVESSRNVTIKGVRVRRGQNGIVLDRVTHSRIYDNDASFLSGWGLALWRSSRNIISRNAFDFCIRGHVEGVYNRGQDAAGILCFEQSNENVFLQNSATHGGDGFFGFAGREALGEFWMEKERARLRRETGREEVDAQIVVSAEVALDFSARGCNQNVLVENDFSYAAAHGIEMTFSEGNVFARNRLVENAICGIWGGYSSETLIAENEIRGNGGMAYGLERGGINMEHASGNRILRNVFQNNKCAVHLWWDDDGALLRSPGVAGNDRGVSGNFIAGNQFIVDADHPFRRLRPDDKLVGLQIRKGGDGGANRVRDNRYGANKVQLLVSNAVEFLVDPGCETVPIGSVPRYRVPSVRSIGNRRPVGARAELRGREQIIMDDWGPWDHERPLVRPLKGASGERVFEIRGVRAKPTIEMPMPGVTPRLEPATNGVWRLALRAPAGVVPYKVRLSAPDLNQEVSGVLVNTEWDLVFFPWTIDPRQDLEGWRRGAESAGAVRAKSAAIDFAYGWGGPRDQVLGETVKTRGPDPDHFGMLGSARLRLPAGNWRFKALSDDGIRLRVQGSTVIENWTWHGPTTDEGTFRQPADGEVTLEIEHFEIDGYSVLRLEIERVEP
ncbi:MAG: right-handed parallel beta-helix repeat-containing protein [Verrucomicrobiales bacterium]|nr:right-handed parallel beta-helix repeat-containing protein [Verrucomicrobiales bacterium]